MRDIWSFLLQTMTASGVAVLLLLTYIPGIVLLVPNLLA